METSDRPPQQSHGTIPHMTGTRRTKITTHPGISARPVEVETGDAAGPLNADFLGGPERSFDAVGREQLIALLEHGLTPESRVLDIGCGCLRGGRWVIPLLDAGHYFGIEPMEHMVEKGVREFLPTGLADEKQPTFDHNDRFDFSIFGNTFSHFIARSIWSHASKAQIEAMLDGVAQFGTDDCVLLASFRPAKLFGRKDYKGKGWVGRSHESAEPGLIRHDIGWIRKAAAARGLTAMRWSRPAVHGQPWCVVRRA